MNGTRSCEKTNYFREVDTLAWEITVKNVFVFLFYSVYLFFSKGVYCARNQTESLKSCLPLKMSEKLSSVPIPLEIRTMFLITTFALKRYSGSSNKLFLFSWNLGKHIKCSEYQYPMKQFTKQWLQKKTKNNMWQGSFPELKFSRHI